MKDTRYLDIHEDDQLDEAQLADWVSKPANCPANECEREVARCVAWRRRQAVDPKCRQILE